MTDITYIGSKSFERGSGTIWTVTTVHLTKDRTRCIGWFSSFESAEQSVLANSGDMLECGEYTHAVIETCREGLYGSEPHGRWYAFTYRPEAPLDPLVAPCPDQRPMTCGYGVG